MNNQDLGIATQVLVMAIVISVILLFVGIGVLVFIHVCIVGRALRRGFTNTTMVERASLGSTSMSREDIEKLPCFDFEGKEKGSSPVDCAVCLDNFKAGEKCRLLPQCHHSFHAQCVDSWLLKAPICPICRTSADTSSHFSDSGREFRETQTTESGRLSEIAIEFRESETTESVHLSEIAIELREGQTMEGTGHLSDTGVKLRGTETIENVHLSDARVEAIENQTALVGAQLNLNASSSENAV